VEPKKRLAELEKYPELVSQRDDLSVEMCDLYNLLGRHEKTLAILTSRQFQPWEGGEGQAIAQYTRAHLAIGESALRAGDLASARRHFESAVNVPENLGEARHLLANQAELFYRLGQLCAAEGNKAEARKYFSTTAAFDQDFQSMSVTPFSEMTYFSVMALKELGKSAAAGKRLRDLVGYAKKLAKTPAKIDYFATSLPTMLLFEDDLQRRQETTALFLQAQAYAAMGKRGVAVRMVREVLRRDPTHAMAEALLAERRSS